MTGEFYSQTDEPESLHFTHRNHTLHLVGSTLRQSRNLISGQWRGWLFGCVADLSDASRMLKMAAAGRMKWITDLHTVDSAAGPLADFQGR